MGKRNARPVRPHTPGQYVEVVDRSVCGSCRQAPAGAAGTAGLLCQRCGPGSPDFEQLATAYRERQLRRLAMETQALEAARQSMEALERVGAREPSDRDG